jgi:MarR family transcriptional regulator for hemolysin
VRQGDAGGYTSDYARGDVPPAQARSLRARSYLSPRERASLSDLAEPLGLSLPSMSKRVDTLVLRELASRQEDRPDRRRVTLNLTPRGQGTLSKVRPVTLEEFCGSLDAVLGWRTAGPASVR